MNNIVVRKRRQHPTGNFTMTKGNVTRSFHFVHNQRSYRCQRGINSVSPDFSDLGNFGTAAVLQMKSVSYLDGFRWNWNRIVMQKDQVFCRNFQGNSGTLAVNLKKFSSLGSVIMAKRVDFFVLIATC